ncbi:MAG: hypothetical protein Q8Q09_20980 [Deltaproteobacteria bacterium]|nr:hypothetical protein [Deltaproteobacteria bacterium]
MKQARADERRVTIRYRADRATGRTSLTIDVEVPEDEMPHEHRQDLKEMAEELLGVPLGSLPADVEVQLKRAGGKEPHDHDHDHAETQAQPERKAIKT